jgi:hypothetical protein
LDISSKMTDRISKIITRVRSARYLNKPGEADLETEEILDAANQIQNKIITESRLEKLVPVIIKPNIAEYHLENSLCFSFHHKNIKTSWKGKFDIVSNNDWDDIILRAPSGNPRYGNLFGGSLFLSPVPTETGKITFRAMQLKPVSEINISTDPELPTEFDDCLVIGIASEFNPEAFLGKFNSWLEKNITNYHDKSDIQISPECNW